jgi:hypothetical protein
LRFPTTAGPGGEYREQIATDGEGRFALEPLESPHASQEERDEFGLRQRARQGFLFRYRDFHVRDARLFEENWSTLDLGRSESVAGRECEVFRVERHGDAGRAFELAIDRETSLILASREFVGGQLVADMAYESVDLQPDLSGVAWHRPGNEERVLLDVEAVEREFGLRALRPRLLPDRYATLEVATVSERNGTTWLKWTYSDGVEPLFFMQALDVSDSQVSAATGVSGERVEPSSVVVFRLGAATAVQGRVEGHRLMAIGQVREVELLDLIESALP